MRLSWIGDMTSIPSLDTGLFICGQNKFVIFEWTSIPNLLVKIEDLSSFQSELGIPGKDPGSMLPGPDGIFIEPSPYGATADGCDKAGLTDISGNLTCAPARQRNLMNGRKFTGDRFNLNDEIWGGKTGGDPVEDAPPILRYAAQRNVFATC
jgi:hypothetical protein